MNQVLTREIVSKITSKGQVTIPSEVRRHLGIKSQDKVAFVMESGGDVHLRPPRYPNINSLAGAAGSLKKPLPWRQVRRIVGEDVARNYSKEE